MIPRLKGTIAYSHDTKLPGEDGEDAATRGWGSRPSLKKDPTRIEVQGWHNN